MDLSDEDITTNITSGIHFIKVAYDFDDIIISTPAYSSKSFKLIHEEDYFRYMLSDTRYKTVKLQSKLKWPNSENTFKKRQRIAKTIYRLMRFLPIKNKQIMFESMLGRKYSCNPRYIYEYLDENHPDWKCIWSLRDEHRPIKGNGIKVRRNSLKYFYYLATSKYLINNGTFFENYVKRKNQVQVQTMHATPYKTLGMDSPGNYETEESRREYIKNTNLWDYITIQGVFTEDKTKTAYGFENEHLRFGYPRTDILFTKNNEEDIRKIKEKFGIPLDKKVILYAPTWRVIHDFELMLDLNSLQKSLSDEYVLIIRTHHVSSKDGDDIENGFVYDLSNFEVAEDIFLISDILITDYSSVMFDYALLDRPILLFTYDLAEYTNNLRGLYFDLTKNNPGPILFTSKEVEEAILNIDEIENEYKPCREKFKKKFLTYECGNSSEKIMKTITKK
ncbi:CDP-glycerol glycerophosphotransferase family protein [Methanobrevibacter sp.]|uniref:CDP-glycerol glycerophosphotransferase family protein n=1 Tax=Methanobrevibacter sp. TaxID=66852 RepID=UPI00388F6996